MVINIPIQINDNVLEGKLSEEYEDKLLQEIGNRVEEYLKSEDDTYRYYGDKKVAEKGLAHLIDIHIDNMIYEHFNEIKGEIIEAARKDIVKRLQSTKEFKQLKPETIEAIRKIFEDEEKTE